MSGRLIVVGLGPGDPRYLTPDAEDALAAAEALYGYGPYLDRVPVRAGQSRHASNNREESARAATALRHAAQGARVAVVSGGDPGVFAMAAVVPHPLRVGRIAQDAVQSPHDRTGVVVGDNAGVFMADQMSRPAMSGDHGAGSAARQVYHGVIERHAVARRQDECSRRAQQPA